MRLSRWITSLLLAGCLFTGCQSSNSLPQAPAALEATKILQTLDSKEDDMSQIEQQKLTLIGAYYYPWYSPDRHWDSGYLGTPILGEYDSADPDVIHQHITWAAEYNIDFFALSWWGKDSFEDKVIQGPYLKVIEEYDFRFAVLYESAGLLNLRDGKIDLDNAVTRQQLVSDFTYLAQTLCQHPHILTIDERPVIFLYLTRTFTGDVIGALSEAKTAAIMQGSAEPFIIGDEVYWHYPDEERIGYFDGITAYNMHTSVHNIADGFAENVDRQYRLWRKIAVQQGTAFLPNILPGFDDTAVRPEANHPVIPRSVELFTAQYDVAKELTSSEDGIVMITSWNEWHEHTSIEPTEEEGKAYLKVLLNKGMP